jgi:AcrR family transcriptional regulator
VQFSASSPRWRRRAQARSEEILEAALEEFNLQGFEAARMEDIARRAGLSKAGVYLYFKSKEDLLQALIRTKVAPLAQGARQIAAEGGADPVLALRTIVGVAVHLLADPKTFAVPRLVLSISGRFPDIARSYRVQVVEVARSSLMSLIESGTASGALRPVDPAAAARAFIGPLLFEGLWTHALGGESALGEPEKMVQSYFDILLNGLEMRA